jgi:tripartite-type tricarboxylate transporter receptor subunit TctC
VCRTPPEIIKQLNDALRPILAISKNRSDLETKGFEVTPSTSDELAVFIFARWKDPVQRAKIPPPD